ncbi:MAG: Crp/Fnr family transcriptional regulator [Gammaproteobacteria bacterium]|jgi:CRP/FNR family transcriptional regulator|nr:Crp/Fnr family transcriptional regulator [Gammaproteobacteria bacterium]
MISIDIQHSSESPCHHCGLAESCLGKLSKTNQVDLVKKQYRLDSGENLTSAGRPLDYLYIVQSGSVKHVHITEEGNELVTDFYFPGDIIGLDSLSTHQHSFQLIALEPTYLCAISMHNLEALTKNQPWAQQSLLSLLSQKLLDRTQALLIQHQHAEQRMAAFLLDLSKRLKTIHQSHLNYDLSMSRQEIGNYLHLSTETVSRIFSKFQVEKLIDVQKKHVVVKNLKGLLEKASV